MKTLIEKFRIWIAGGIAAVLGFVGGVEAKAQLINGKSNAESALNTINQELKKTTGSIVDIALIAVGLIAVIIMVWALAKKKKGDNNANDAIAEGAMYTAIAAGAILLIKTLFFGN